MTIQTPTAAAPAGAAIRRAARRWFRARLAARQLARMEDHLLRDIGLTRDAVRGNR
jgi:uncharacterized protein YjiS (DUF1127 family)